VAKKSKLQIDFNIKYQYSMNMKKTNLFTVLTMIALLGLFQLNANAQDTIVQWTFPTEDGTADAGVIPGNLTKVIETTGGTSEIQFKNGVTTKAAQATGWEAGADEKEWKVEFKTSGYGNIKLSSVISSGGQDPGPRDFKVQFKVDNGSWTDIEDSDFQTANDWASGVLFEFPIPAACDNQAIVKIRWIMTSDTASDGSIVAEDGKSKIDDIFITGEIIDGDDEMGFKQGIKVYPNPADDYIVVESSSSVQLNLYNINGKEIISKQGIAEEKIDVSELNPGTYILKANDLKTKLVTTHKIIIQ